MEGNLSAPARHSSSVGLSADAAQEIGEQIVRRLDRIPGVMFHGSAFDPAARVIADEVQQVVALQLSRATPAPESVDDELPVATTLDDSRVLLLPEDVAAITQAVQQRLVRIAFADVVQVAQARLELTELEARCRRLQVELRFANENRDNLAADFHRYRQRSDAIRKMGRWLREQQRQHAARHGLGAIVAAEACCDADSLALDDSGPSYAYLSEQLEQPEPGNGGAL